MDELHAAEDMLYGPWFPMAEFCLVRDWILIEVTDEQRALLGKIRVTDCVSAPRWDHRGALCITLFLSRIRVGRTYG